MPIGVTGAWVDPGVPVSTPGEITASNIGSGEVVGCIGTDAAMLAAVPVLVVAGCRVKVFEGRPVPIVADSGLTLSPSPSSMLLAVAGLTRMSLRMVLPLPAPRVVRRLFAALPGRLDEASAAAHRHWKIRDRWLRHQMTPDRRICGQGLLRSDQYYWALQQDNCELVSWPIAGVHDGLIRTCDGLEHRIDRVVVAN